MLFVWIIVTCNFTILPSVGNKLFHHIVCSFVRCLGGDIDNKSGCIAAAAAEASVMRDRVGFGADWAAGSYFLEADASHVWGGGGLDFWGKTPYVSCRA